MAERATFAALLAERDQCHEMMADVVDDDNALDDLYEVRARLVWLEDEIFSKVEEATTLLDAAPAVLEALEAVMSYVHNVRKHIDDGFALGLVFEFEKIVTAAIAKAKGETA